MLNMFNIVTFFFEKKRRLVSAKASWLQSGALFGVGMCRNTYFLVFLESILWDLASSGYVHWKGHKSLTFPLL